MMLSSCSFYKNLLNILIVCSIGWSHASGEGAPAAPEHKLHVMATSASFKGEEAFASGDYDVPDGVPAVLAREHDLGAAYSQLLMRPAESGGYDLVAQTDGGEVPLHTFATTAGAFVHEEVAIHNGEAVYVIDVDVAPDGRLIFNALRGNTAMDLTVGDCRLGRNTIRCCEVDTGHNDLIIKARAFCLDYATMKSHTTRIESETDPVFGNYVLADEEQSASVGGASFLLRPHIPNGSRMDITGDLVLIGPEGGRVYLNYLDVEIGSGLCVNLVFNPAGYFEPLPQLGFLHMSSCHVRMTGSMFVNANTRELMQMGDTREHRGAGPVSHLNFPIARTPYLEIGGESHLIGSRIVHNSPDGRFPNGHEGAAMRYRAGADVLHGSTSVLHDPASNAVVDLTPQPIPTPDYGRRGPRGLGMGPLAMAAGEMSRMRHAVMRMAPASAVRFDVSLPSASADLASVAHRLSTPAGLAMHAIEAQARHERRLREVHESAMVRRALEEPDYARAAEILRAESDAFQRSLRAAADKEEGGGEETSEGAAASGSRAGAITSLPAHAIQSVEDVLAIGQDVHVRAALRAGALMPGLSPLDEEFLQARMWRALAVDVESGDLVADASGGSVALAEAAAEAEAAPAHHYLPEGEGAHVAPRVVAAVGRGASDVVRTAGRVMWDGVRTSDPWIPAAVEAVVDAHEYYRTEMLATYQAGPEAYMRARESDYNTTEGEGAFAALDAGARGRLMGEWSDDFNSLRPLGLVGTILDGITHTVAAAASGVGDGVRWVSRAGGSLLAHGLAASGMPTTLAEEVGYTADVGLQWTLGGRAIRGVSAVASGAGGGVTRGGNAIRGARAFMAGRVHRDLTHRLASQRLARSAVVLEAQQTGRLRGLNLDLSTRAVNANVTPVPPVFARAVGGGIGRAAAGGEGRGLRAVMHEGGGAPPRAPRVAAHPAASAPAARDSRAPSETLSSARAGDLAATPASVAGRLPAKLFKKYGDRVDLGRMTVRVSKRRDAPFYRDPKTGYSIQRDRAVQSGSGAHGPSYWKLYDKDLRCVATLDQQGRVFK